MGLVIERGMPKEEEKVEEQKKGMRLSCGEPQMSEETGLKLLASYERKEEAIVQKKKRLALNVGSFTVQFKSTDDTRWVNIDKINLIEWSQQQGFEFLWHDITKGVPYQDGEVDLINCCHLIEHLSVDEGIAFLKECKRALKVGGTVRICYPDLEKHIDAFLKGEMDKFVDIQPPEYKESPTQADKFWRLLTAGHSTCYDIEAIMYVLKEAGFVEIMKVSHDKELDMFPEVSLSVEAKKPSKGSSAEDVMKMVDDASKMPLYKKYLTGIIAEGKEEFEGVNKE